MLKNLSARANSTKPSTTLITLSQPPDFGRALSQEGNMANKVNGMAKARE